MYAGNIESAVHCQQWVCACDAVATSMLCRHREKEGTDIHRLASYLVQATQDPQSISNTLAPFMALANTTNVTGCVSHPYELIRMP